MDCNGEPYIEKRGTSSPWWKDEIKQLEADKALLIELLQASLDIIKTTSAYPRHLTYPELETIEKAEAVLEKVWK